MAKGPYDIAVIGGGVNGAGIARDAAGRGARVILIEAGDLAQGTSSASTKLIHGGLRYLEHYEFGLVREALKERETLWSIAPHIIWPMRFVLPYVEGLRPRWLLRAGLFLYDHIGGRRLLPATETVDLAQHPAGAALRPGFSTGFVYSDGWVDDARLVILNARDAADMGAEVRTRSGVTGLARYADHWTLTLATGETIDARAIVNAAGPGVLKLLDKAHIAQPFPMRLVRGSHIVVRRLFDHDYCYFFQLPDGRIFFAIPYERDFTLIGTTDRDHSAGEPIAASVEEIAYLCEGASGFFKTAITPDDVVWTYSGVRPLADDQNGRPEAASRGYRLILEKDGGAPMLSVFGGKITTYRHLAESAVNELRPLLPAMHGGPWTATRALPGGDFGIDGIEPLRADLAGRYPFLDAAWLDRLLHAYGDDVSAMLGEAATLADCGTHFGYGLTMRELEWLRDKEWAQTAEDVLWRCTKLGLHLSAEQQSRVRETMGA